MKKSVFTILLSFVFIFAQAQTEDDGMHITGALMFNENSEAKEAFVLVSDANLRDKPSTKAATVAQLPIATKVQILSKTTDSLKMNGVHAAWFRVSANGKTGYLWSGILTTVAITELGDDPESVTYLAGISSYNEKDSRVTLQVRAVKKGKEIAKTEFPSVGDIGYDLSITLKGGGFDKVKQVLSVEMNYGACDYSQGDNLVFFTEGGKLSRQMETISASSAGAGYASQNYILPSDKGGIAGHVLVTEDSAAEEEVMKNGVPEYKIKDQKYKITLHKWTGVKLEKVFSR
jgi:Bacterial SH3 domain